MGFIPTPIAGLWVFEPTVFEDERGWFYESYRKDLFEKAGLHYEFVQDNEAASSYGVLRGLHFQTGEAAQAKLVRVTQGEVLDVVVDIRPGSQSYGQHYSIRLSATNRIQLMVPRGFAHGYVVLSPKAIFQYKCDNYYQPGQEGGLRYNDPELGIDWILPQQDLILSEKDRRWPLWQEQKDQ